MNPSTLQNAMARLGDLDPPRGLAMLSTPDRPVPDPVQKEAFVGPQPAVRTLTDRRQAWLLLALASQPSAAWLARVKVVVGRIRI